MTPSQQGGPRDASSDDDHLAKGEGGRFARPEALDAMSGEVRCACRACGAHLMAVRLGSGRYAGVCCVCGGDEVSPVR